MTARTWLAIAAVWLLIILTLAAAIAWQNVPNAFRLYR